MLYHYIASTKTRLHVMIQQFHSWYITSRNACMYLPEGMHMNARLHSTIHNSTKMETAQMFIHSKMDK